jgi:hypothetical protein
MVNGKASLWLSWDLFDRLARFRSNAWCGFVATFREVWWIAFVRNGDDPRN